MPRYGAGGGARLPILARGTAGAPPGVPSEEAQYVETSGTHHVRATAAAVAATGLLAGLGAAAGTGSAAAATRAGSAAPGGDPQGSASPVISATTNLPLRRYVAAGTGAYVIGAEDGTFPPIGWHITGQMGGVWAPPIKLLDGLWFSVGGQWLGSAAKYTTGPGFVRMSFPVTGGLQPTLTEFAPDGQPTALFGLTLTPVNGQATTASVAADAHSQVASAYPWTSTTPTFDSYNHQNTVSASGGIIQFGQQSRPWYAEVGANPQPATVRTGTGFWGPTPASQQTVFGTKGQGGQLAWNLSIPADGKTLWLGVAGSHTGAGASGQRAQGRAGQPGGLLAGKVAARDATAALTNVKVPDASVQQAILWSKLNLADLRRTITQAAIRDTKAGTVYPKPLATLPELSASMPPTPTTPSSSAPTGPTRPTAWRPRAVADRHTAPQHAAHGVADREREHRKGRPRDHLHRGRVLRRQHRAR